MTMRGAYAAKLDLAQPNLSGVREKINAQAEALGELPASIDIYHLSDGVVVRNGAPTRWGGPGRVLRRFAHYLFFHIVLAAHREPLDFLYMRYQGSSPLSLWALARLRRRNPRMMVLVEFPSWPDHTEAVSPRERLLGWIDRRCRANLHRYVDRVVTFSRESEILGIPTIATDNGVAVDRTPLIAPRAPDRVLRLAGLANLSFWHGYDRIIEGMGRYYAGGGTHEVHFDVVGTGSELDRLRTIAARHGLDPRVSFHGARRGTELEAILSRADIGISSIGMHRLDVDTSNLKSREFCARGLPFVIAYPDRDFPPGLPFVFHAPADDSPIDIGGLLAFFEALEPDLQGCRARMRTYAEQNLSWNSKMAPVLLALKEGLEPA